MLQRKARFKNYSFRKASIESIGLQFCFVLHESFNRDMIDVSEISSRI
jgi:hypothetical protein